MRLLASLFCYSVFEWVAHTVAAAPDSGNRRSSTTLFITSVEVSRCTFGRAERRSSYSFWKASRSAQTKENIVGVAEQPLSLDHLRQCRHSGLESLHGGAVALAERGENDGPEIQPQRRRIEPGAIVADDPGLFKGSHAPMARRQAEPDPISQFGHSEASVDLQLGKNLSIDHVHTRDIAPNCHPSARLWENIQLARW